MLVRPVDHQDRGCHLEVAFEVEPQMKIGCSASHCIPVHRHHAHDFLGYGDFNDGIAGAGHRPE